jgi:hypothetical protein
MQADLNVPQAFTTRFTCSSTLIFSIWMDGCQLQGPHSTVLIVKQLFISQSISSHILWDPQANHLVHNNPPLVPIRSQINPVQVLPPYFLKTHFNIIHKSTPVFQVVSYPQVSLPKPCTHLPLLNTFHTPLPSHSPDLITWKIFIEQYTS